MTRPRSQIVSRTQRATYHCVTRCVRRAFLCGNDPVTGMSFEHRKRWIVHRVQRLASVYAVAVHAYAVMSNHVHLVIETDPTAPYRWSDEEVATRWLKLFGGRKLDARQASEKHRALLGDSERLGVLRHRLGDLSWFMRCLNEYVARRANKEDDCRGRFWEGRFRCQRLLDLTAILCCMVYVDLNPWRARQRGQEIVGEYTSLAARLDRTRGSPGRLDPVVASIAAPLEFISFSGYLALVRQTARRPGRGSANRSTRLPKGLSHRLYWTAVSAPLEDRFGSAVGTASALRAWASENRLAWVKGVGALGRSAPGESTR